MFRLSKICDYGLVLLAHLARHAEQAPHGARELAEALTLPAPMVSKVLKRLARSGILASQRGSHGGYALAAHPDAISVAAMIDALDGPVGITECTRAADLCSHEQGCAVRSPLHVINGVVRESLASITLADLIDPHFSRAMPTLQVLGAAEPPARATRAASPPTGKA